MNGVNYYKIEVFIPKEFLKELSEIFKRFDIGHIGKYSECLSYSEVTSRWKSLDGSDPYIGEINELTEEKELKVEATCKTEIINEVVNEIKNKHPYEEPVINVIPLYKIGI